MESFAQKFKHKWENYWYHYTVHTIIGFAVAVVVILMIANIVNPKVYDLPIGYIGKEPLVYERAEGTLSALEDICTDVNDDSKIMVSLDIMQVSDVIRSQEDMEMQDRIMINFVGGKTRLFILEKEYAESYSDMFCPLEGVISKDKLEGGIKFEGKVVAVPIKPDNPVVSEWGLESDNLYIGAIDIVPAQKNMKYIDKLFSNSVKALKYILGE